MRDLFDAAIQGQNLPFPAPWDRQMPVPQGPRPEEPHRLRDTRLALPDETRQKAENEYIRPQQRPTLKVYEVGTQKPVNTFYIRLI
jgi:hypothetical protein